MDFRCLCRRLLAAEGSGLKYRNPVQLNVKPMAIETSYTSLREKLASVLDRVVENQEVVIVRRRGARDVALVPADELAGLLETAHLLRSPKNARRLLTALRRAGRSLGKPQSIDKLRAEMGLGPPR
jgi:antitoxin YefM